MAPGVAATPRRKPNFIVILCDDLGYGDIQPTGGKSTPTPTINRLARDGMLLTDYYAPPNLRTPSRAGLLTGRYPIRTGLAWGVILQGDTRILPVSEVTIPKALKPAGYDGGYRVPCIAWQPGVVPAEKRCNSIAMGIDFLPTLCAMAGQPNPPGVTLDGKDITPVLMHGAPSPHDALFLFDDEEVTAVRTQRWKCIVSADFHGHVLSTDHAYPQLYDVAADPSESYSVHQRYPDVLA